MFKLFSVSGKEATAMIAALMFSCLLSACGGGGDSTSNGVPPQLANQPVTTPPTSTVPPSAPIILPPILPPPANVADGITSVKFENVSTAQVNVPITFGQVFAPGDVKVGDVLGGKFADGSTIALQVNEKAHHADGSLRHAIISTVLPALAANQVLAMTIGKTSASSSAGASNPGTPVALLDRGFTAQISLTLNGEHYTASPIELMRAGTYQTWLAGPLVNEWIVAAPFKAQDGSAHPHLMARFAIRHFVGTNLAKVDVTIENGWAYEPNPQNFTYDVDVSVGGKSVYAKAALTHFQHARWRKTFWYGANPQVNIQESTTYLISSKAVPNYDPNIVVSPTALAALATGWSGAKTEPMGPGQAMAAMPTTGGRPDIGIMPAWNTMYLLSMDKRARDVALGTADLAGSWSSHYRDKNTDRPVSLADYPYMTILGHLGDTYNPVTKQYEMFPACATGADCSNPTLIHDTSHQPGFAYLPYLLTGDYYYLEELQFWAMWSSFSYNPGYRDNIKGLVKSDQVRGQAWSLRTLAEAAYITPDSDILKPQLTSFVNNNLDWYTATYPDDVTANTLGIIINGYSIVYNNGVGMAPWMDDFFTSAVGHAAELGFTKAQRLLEWKVKFPIARMVGSGACWVDGGIYALTVRDSSTSPIYASFGQAYQASHNSVVLASSCGGSDMATALSALLGYTIKAGEMPGYSGSNTGYPSNMQPALAYGADVGGADGKAAWQQFMARSVKPDYTTGPQFAIVPR